jgi:hypothetical protein
VELANTLEHLLGSTARSAADRVLTQFPADVDQQGQVTLEFEQLHSEAHVAAIADVATAAAFKVIDDPYQRGVLGSCGIKGDPIPASCAEAYLKKLGPRALRRPMAADELASLMAGYDPNQGMAGLKLAITRLLMAPSYVFHVEEGQPGSAGARVRLTDHEVANRLAYRISADMPDAELTAAADRGELRSADVLKAHARRIISAARGKESVARFYTRWLRLDDTPSANASAAQLLLGLNNNDGDVGERVRRDLVSEALAFTDHVTWKMNGTLRDLLTAPIVFAGYEASKPVYGTAPSATKVAVDAPDGRGGALLRGALLLSDGPVTHPILRGARLRKFVLCDVFPPPDPAQVAQAVDAAGAPDRTQVTTRQYTERLTAAPACRACHAQINPLGYALEGFN